MDIYGLKSIASPCQGCKERWINESGRCHSTCEKYIEFKKIASETNKMINEERQRALRNPIKEDKTMAQLNRMKKARRK